MNWIKRLFSLDCQVCNALREQLEYERKVNQEYLETLSSLLKPPPIVVNSVETGAPVESKFQTFARRRAALEAADRAQYELIRNSKLAATPDKKSNEELEKEINLETENVPNNSDQTNQEIH